MQSKPPVPYPYTKPSPRISFGHRHKVNHQTIFLPYISFNFAGPAINPVIEKDEKLEIEENIASSVGDVDLDGSLATEKPGEGEKKKEKKKKKKKGRCTLEGCDGRVVLLVGECKFCNQGFCQAHRMPEAHACPGLKDCRAQAFANNAAAVGGMKCAGMKLQSI